MDWLHKYSPSRLLQANRWISSRQAKDSTAPVVAGVMNSSKDSE